MKILIVDDDKKLCRLVADYLEPMGYETAVAHNGAQGLQMIREGDYQAVILDVMMPGMDGFEVLKRLRNESDIPVLMLTARGEDNFILPIKLAWKSASRKLSPNLCSQRLSGQGAVQNDARGEGWAASA